jgi:hypothetical protein
MKTKKLSLSVLFLLSFSIFSSNAEFIKQVSKTGGLLWQCNSSSGTLFMSNPTYVDRARARVQIILPTGGVGSGFARILLWHLNSGDQYESAAVNINKTIQPWIEISYAHGNGFIIDRVSWKIEACAQFGMIVISDVYSEYING